MGCFQGTDYVNQIPYYKEKQPGPGRNPGFLLLERKAGWIYAKQELDSSAVKGDSSWRMPQGKELDKF
jgi:hypothetical protein